MKTNEVNVFNNQRGEARIIAVAGILGLSAYLILGIRAFGLPTFVNWGIIGVLSVMTLFSIGYFLHMQLLGGAGKDLYRDLQGRAAELEKLLFEAAQKEREYEHQMIERIHIISRKGTECLANVKKIMGGLERRLNEVKKLLHSRSQLDLMAAHELLQQKLSVGGSSLDTLIDTEPLPALAPYEWAFTLERLFGEIEVEVAKAIEIQQQYRRVA